MTTQLSSTYTITPSFRITNPRDLALALLFDHPWEQTIRQNSQEHFTSIYNLLQDRLKVLKKSKSVPSSLEIKELQFILESLLSVKRAMHENQVS